MTIELKIAPIRQKISEQELKDIPSAVRQGLEGLPLEDRIKPGMRAAIALGSRGISCLPEVVRTLVEELRRVGAQPFIVPAMGSHGGGTPEGQRAVLEGYGLGEAQLGLPIRDSMEVVQVGTTPAGMPVYTSAEVMQAGAIVLVNRIKEHTSFKAEWESGLLKMLAVGLGKDRGAAEIHNWGIAEAMPAAARVLLEKLPAAFGIGIVENGRHAPARIAVLKSECIFEEEPALLNEARQLALKIPLEPLDLLILQEIGKDISGTGMDLNVVGMWRRTGGPVAPRFKLIGALDLTDLSHGNAIGIGFADLITRRLLEKADLETTYLNCLTAKNLAAAKIPLTLETDRGLFETALAGTDPATARVVIARNTLALENFWVSSSLLPDIEAHPLLEQVGPPQIVVFNEQGTLILP